MATSTQQQPRRPKIKFRVLIIGRANAGKTSILQRVCDTTDSPIIYRGTGRDKERIQLDPSMERGEHRIEDELIFSNHDGYVFHDSRGFESGGNEELKIVQDFVRKKSGEKRLASRLHAIWYCIPMDNKRPELDLKHFKDICPDQNVPVIAVFTKYDQFKRDMEMDLEDKDLGGSGTAHEIQNYLDHLGDGAKYVLLEKMHKKNGNCKNLIEKTAGALNEDVVTLMLVAVQRSNLELSVKLAVERSRPHFRSNSENIVNICLKPFPFIWLHSMSEESDFSFSSEMFFKIIMPMTIIKQLSSENSQCHLMTALIIILKHATTLRLSSISSQSALNQAEINFKKLNIGLKIAQHFSAPPEEYSVQNFVDFVMGVSL